GDIIQQEPLLRGLRQKYPEAEIHLLLNKQFASIGKLLADVVDQFIEFDRESLQKGLGEANCNILWSYSRLEELVNSLNTQGYDQIFNFTHNKLSAYLIGALQAPQKNGLYHQNEKFCGLENRWLRYFNDRFSGTQKSLFHYVELLSGSFGIPAVSKTSHEKIKSKWILLQPLTSDVKKNWGLRNFLELKKTIETVLVDYRVGVLGAPFEREQLSKVFSDNDLVICDLVEVQEHLRKTALLISGDTSIKHLAASMGTPLVEIVIGSSDSGKTGALSENVRRVQTTVNCAPCSHSQPCHQKSHLCAEEIQIDQVFAKVWEQLSNEPRSLQWETRDLERAV
ncbi:MAG TPA: glycosyltransferase family 9 protein, partial [Bdellovibrio sp.]|nr:glycosyltransferase family 9 protein [Bdellovibrio sp.]